MDSEFDTVRDLICNAVSDRTFGVFLNILRDIVVTNKLNSKNLYHASEILEDCSVGTCKLNMTKETKIVIFVVCENIAIAFLRVLGKGINILFWTTNL